jgi:hypothetical protein
MQPVKYLKIDSFDTEDTNALFEAMCVNIAHLTPFEGKCRILDISGSKEKIDAYKASLADVLKFVKKYDIKFDFKVTYVSTNPADEKKKPIPNFSAGLSEDYSKVFMREQAEDIKDPELKETSRPVKPVIADPPPSIKMDLNNLPEPPAL